MNSETAHLLRELGLNLVKFLESFFIVRRAQEFDELVLSPGENLPDFLHDVWGLPHTGNLALCEGSSDLGLGLPEENLGGHELGLLGSLVDDFWDFGVELYLDLVLDQLIQLFFSECERLLFGL